MSKLALTIVAIALPDCLNPSLIGGELLVATRPHARSQVAAFTIAAGTITLLFGVAFALGLGDLILAIVPKPGPTVKYGLITGAGLVMALGGVIIVTRRNALTASVPTAEAPTASAPTASAPTAEAQTAEAQTAEEHHAHGSAALIGAGLAGAELLTAFPYFAAIALIVGSGVSNAGKFFLLGLYCIIYTLPLIVIAVLVAVMGERAGRILRPAGDWLTVNWPLVVGPFTGALGVGVLAFGITQLS